MEKKIPEILLWLCHYGVFSVNEGDINQNYLSIRLHYQNKVTDLNVVLIWAYQISHLKISINFNFAVFIKRGKIDS